MMEVALVSLVIVPLVYGHHIILNVTLVTLSKYFYCELLVVSNVPPSLSQLTLNFNLISLMGSGPNIYHHISSNITMNRKTIDHASCNVKSVSNLENHLILTR